jgi:hypothetical protein
MKYLGISLVLAVSFLTIGCLEVAGEPSGSASLSKPAMKKLVASDGKAYDMFGSSVAVSGNGEYLLVGASSARIGWDYYQGKVYLYKWDNSAGWMEIKTFVASDGVFDEYFGGSSAISGDGTSVLIGAHYADIGSSAQSGSAYLYQWNGAEWLETKMIASDTAAGDCFGKDVDISDDGLTLVIGAPYKNSSKGQAYIYRWNGSGWTEYILTASDGVGNDRFGYSVAVNANGSTAVAGAYNDTVGANSFQGSAYVYKWIGSAYSEANHLTASDGAANDSFAISLDISVDGSVIAVGAPNDDNGTTNNQGKVYLYRYNGTGSWEEVRLTHSDPATGDMFGNSVALSENGGWVLIGAYAKSSSQGAAYLFQRNDNFTWTQSKKITAYDAANSDYFGHTIAISSDGKEGLIGADYADINNATNQGTAYLYHW